MPQHISHTVRPSPQLHTSESACTIIQKQLRPKVAAFARSCQSHTRTHTLTAPLYLSQMVFWLSCCFSFSVAHTQLLALIYLFLSRQASLYSMFSCSCCRQTLRPCNGTIVSNNNLYLLCNQFATNYSCFSHFLVAVAFV